MYKLFYGLAESPFNLTPDSRFLYLSERHQEALAALVFGVQERKGFICLTGEIGSGKTTLVRKLLSQLDRGRVKVAMILNSYLTDLEMLKTINEEYGLPSESDSKKALLDDLNRFLVEQYRQNVICLLIIDEAQNLRPETLEQIRMISNLETETDKLIQIMLVGQPELRHTLALPELEQLNQRIQVRYHMTPLAEDEIGAYIFHRLRVARAQINIQFTPQALRLIHHYAKGIPRRINVICDRCLLVGYVMGRYDIDGEIVEQAAREIRGEVGEDSGEETAVGPAPERWHKRYLGKMAAVAALFAIAAGGVWLGAAFKQMTVRGDLAQASYLAPSPEVEPAPAERTQSDFAHGAAPDKPEIEKEASEPSNEAQDEEAAAQTPEENAPPENPDEEIEIAAAESIEATPEPTPTPKPEKTPPLYPAWEYDADGVVRVYEDAQSEAAAYLTLLRLWDIEVDLTTFAEASPEDIARYDLPAMVRQLDFRIFRTNDLTEALKVDLPMLLHLDATDEHPERTAALKRMQGDLFTVADPLRGVRIVRRSEIELRIREIRVLYRDPQALTDLAPGAEGESVKVLQSVLHDVGALSGRIDGKFGPQVHEALRAFQRDHFLPETGMVNPMTAAYIYAHTQAARPRLYS